MTVAWNPEKYLEFGDLRTRPAMDLLARVPDRSPRLVIDLGCGPGNSTRLLKQRWPAAAVNGVDSSAEMLAKAAREVGDSVHWQQVSIEAWQPETSPDVIFSNAALHWVADHARLFPRLMRQLAPGGVLAVQMPHRAGHQPYVEALHQLAQSGPWAERFAELPWGNPSPAPEQYYQWLAPHAARIDIWTIEYLQVLAGNDPVFEWTRSTAQRPFIAQLSAAETAEFTEAYRARLRQLYPPQADGHTLFAFLRLFIVARRGSE